MAKPNRRLTKEQFAENTTIDGNRIEKSQDETVDRFNNLKNIDIKRRFTQTQYVFGYVPPANVSGDVAPTFSQSCAPWAREDNVNYFERVGTPAGWQLTTSLTTPSNTEITNKHRVKGHRRTTESHGTVGLGEDGRPDAYVWRNTFYFGKPVIIDAVQLAMVTDISYYKNYWQWGVDVPPRAQASPTLLHDEWLDLLMLEITVDNPYVPENQSLTNIVYKKNNFQVDCEFYQWDQPGGGLSFGAPPVHDMMPAVDDVGDERGTPYGVRIDDQNLNICIPEKSRVTMSIVIPWNLCKTNANSFSGPDGGGSARHWNEWEGQIVSGCLTVLEETE